MDPEDSEVCLRYILAHAKRRGNRIFGIFSTQEKTDHLVESGKGWLEHEGKRVALQERWQSERQDANYEGTVAKASPCSDRRIRTPLPQQSSSSTREEESQWSSVEVKRKWCVAFEDAAKRMLKYLEKQRRSTSEPQ